VLKLSNQHHLFWPVRKNMSNHSQQPIVIFQTESIWRGKEMNEKKSTMLP